MTVINSTTPDPTLEALYWSPDNRPPPPTFQNTSITATIILTNLEKHASLSPEQPSPQEKYDQIIYDNITPDTNPLAALHVAINHMTDNARIFIYFSNINHNPRIERWRDFWVSIANRLGLQTINKTDWILTLAKAPPPPRWHLKLADEQDIEGIRSLFKIAFGSEMPQEVWHWKYAQGRGNAIVAYRNNELVAHYGGLFRRISFNGSSSWALQPADVMVHPKERGMFTRNGLFSQITATWAEMYGSINFGFPTERSMALGEKIGIYRKAGELVELHWPTQQAKPLPWNTRIEPAKTLTPKLRLEIDKLWNQMRTALPHTAIGFRDHQWIDYRYIAHPTIDYKIYIIRNRWTNNLHSLIVLKKLNNICELVDIVSDPQKIHNHLSICIHLAAELGCTTLSTWITKDRMDSFLHFNPEVSETGIEIPADAWTDSSYANELIGKWWLMPGDTDFR